MISQDKAIKRQVQKLVDAAERLAAVQYEAGLKSGKPAESKIKNKVNKCWIEFGIARDAVLSDYRETPILVRWKK